MYKNRMKEYRKKKDCQGVNLPDFLQKCMNLIGSSCMLKAFKGMCTFKGIAQSSEDYYYIIEDKEGEIHYISTIVDITFIANQQADDRNS